jgi:hypothetical protein
VDNWPEPEDLIRGIAQLKPTAKLGSKFQYQNLMYVAAGEVAAGAAKMSFEQLVTSRIFTPLNMPSTSFNHTALLNAPDHATGYVSVDGKMTPQRLMNPSVIAAAGGIVSNARDMGEWVRFMLAGGRANGRALLKSENFAELVKPQIKVGVGVDYGLGWMLHEWEGQKIIEHGGDLGVIQTQVALMPSRGIGFALLTNSGDNQLREAVIPMVWSYLGSMNDIPTPALAEGGASGSVAIPSEKHEAGNYAYGGIGKDFAVRFKDGKLTLDVPGQSPYLLVPLGERRYKFANVADFKVTFRPAQHLANETEMLLEQPQGPLVLQKRRLKPLVREQADWSELIGVYQDKKLKTVSIEIANVGGHLTMVVPGQPSYPLTVGGGDVFALGGLNPGSLAVRRGTKNEVIGLTLAAPSGKHELDGPSLGKADITLAQLSELAIAASGGGERLASFTSLVTEFESTLTGGSQGITERGTSQTSGERTTTTTTRYVFGKPIYVRRDLTTSTGGATRQDNEKSTVLIGQLLRISQIGNSLQEVTQWQTLYKKVRLIGVRKIDGVSLYVVVKSHFDGMQQFDYYNTETFHLARRVFRITVDNDKTGEKPVTQASNEGKTTDVIIRYSDYRDIDGLQFPHKTITGIQGEQSNDVTTFTSVRVNVATIKADFDIETPLP